MTNIGRLRDSLQDLLELLSADNGRIDFFSSSFGRPSEFEDDSKSVESSKVLEPSVQFNRDNAGPPIKEPWFGTYYWVEDLDTEILGLWNALAAPQMPPPESMLSLPPKNPFVPTRFEIKPTPPEDTDQPVHNGEGTSENIVMGGTQFPTVPPSRGILRLPQLIHRSQAVDLWHLQDRVFLRPIAELRVAVHSGCANDSALNRACTELLVQICHDALTERVYLAALCEIGCSVETAETGIGFRINVGEDGSL